MNIPDVPTPYYASTAYRSDCIPQQPPSAKRSWLRRFGNMRLPWGMPQQVATEHFVSQRKPSTLRFQEKMNREREEKQALGTYVPAPFEHLEFHACHDHERFKFSLWSKRSQFWIYMHIFGKWTFLMGLPFSVFTLTVLVLMLDQPWRDTSEEILGFYAWFLGSPLCFWGLASLIIFKFPHLWIKPSRGPIWELNRRTGLVTLFDYKNNGEYKKNGTIGELTAPFYEFDAYIVSTPDRQGLAINVLYLAHRYRDIVISFGAIQPPDELEVLCALWDHFQNYMDTSQPLPDLPRYEAFRHLDPTTAAYDLKVPRNPRFWIDMNDEDYKQQLHALRGRIDRIDTFDRLNLMMWYVEYFD